MKDSQGAGRVARRCYGTVSSTTDRSRETSLAREAKYAAQPWAAASVHDNPAPKTRSSSQFYIPSVLLNSEAAKSPTVHKIHILGEDERSKFIAHALSGVYDSVELLGWRRNASSKYNNIQRRRSRISRDHTEAVAISATPRLLAEEDDSHIDRLVVTGKASEAIEALKAVKHRVDENTSVCIMNDGLGVLEDVRRKIFEGTDATPSFLLGHMSHRLAFNRNTNSVNELKSGQLQLMVPETPRTMTAQQHSQTERRVHFVKSLQQVKTFNSILSPLDQWLRFKLPSVLFDSVVEPVCVLLEMPYEGLLQNPAARHMMHDLLSEILLVIENLPEVQGSAVIRDFVQSNGPRRLLYNGIMAKRSAPSLLMRQIANGLPTDVDYLNGYFVRRATKLGLDTRTNSLIRHMIKARHSQAIEKQNSFVPLEETSVPSELGFRYRNSPY